MPKTGEKKLKTIKSHYAYETRKDVDLAELESLKLEACWPLIRNEIEKEIGDDRLVCVPFITEAQFYRVSSTFACCEASDQETQKPMGNLLSMIDEDRSDPDYVQWLKEASFEDDGFHFPHESVKITLQDENSKNKVRVIMMNLFRLNFPKDKSPVGKIYLKISKGLEEVKSVDIITDVLMAKTVEFRANQGSSSRIFHLGSKTPLVFSSEKFNIDEDGKLISQVKREQCKKMVFNRASTKDILYTGPENLNVEN